MVKRQGNKAATKRGERGFFVWANSSKTLDCSKTRRLVPSDAYLQCRDVDPATRGCISFDSLCGSLPVTPLEPFGIFGPARALDRHPCRSVLFAVANYLAQTSPKLCKLCELSLNLLSRDVTFQKSQTLAQILSRFFPTSCFIKSAAQTSFCQITGGGIFMHAL